MSKAGRLVVAAALLPLLAGCTAPAVSSYREDVAQPPVQASPEPVEPSVADVPQGDAAAEEVEAARVAFCEPAAAWYVDAFSAGSFEVGTAGLSEPPDPELVEALSGEFRRARDLALAAADAAEPGGLRTVLERFASLSDGVLLELADPDLTLEGLMLLLSEPAEGSAAYDLAALIYSPEAEMLFDLIEDSCAEEIDRLS